MLVPMAKVRILGRRVEVEHVLGELHALGLVEIADARVVHALEGLDGEESRAARGEELGVLLARTDALLAERPAGSHAADAEMPRADDPLDVSALRTELERLSTRVEDLERDLVELRDEGLVLQGHLDPLRQLLPLVPELADLDAERLALLQLATVALVLNTGDERVVETLREELVEALGARFTLVWTRVDDGATGCLVVIRTGDRDAVRTLLGRAAVRSVALPERFGGLSLQETVDAMQRRADEVAKLVTDLAEERRTFLLPYGERLQAVRVAVAEELERLQAVGRLGATRRTFLAVCWVPRRQLPQLRRELDSRLGSAVLVEDMAGSPYDRQAPVLMHNTRPARPLESLVRFLELPRSGSVDPTFLMALFLPLMFGAMVGDVGYGAALLLLAFLARRRLARRSTRTPELAGLVWVLLVGATWSVVFGFFYGEFFGDLGKRLVGDWALWEYRPSAGALEPLLVFAVVIGAAHVALGLGLGAWQAVRLQDRRDLADKLGMLLALGGLGGLAGWATDRLPAAAWVPSVAALVVGLAVVMSVHGLLGIATGPLDLLGRLGNILSYLRLAAVGLASAHLAGVANQLGTVGPIWVGVLVAVFFHTLNLALASFSPMIQALRLQYVEFFGAFFIGGGRAFKPFGRVPERVT